MNSLFGVELPTPVNFVIAFVVVLVLIGAAAWLVRRFGATRLDAAARGRQPRLAVIDSAAVDGRRKLVIIRRDNVEHLLMIGGPTDVVVETNIVRAAVGPRHRRAAQRSCRARSAPCCPTPRPGRLQPEPMPAPAHAVRAERGAARGRTRAAALARSRSRPPRCPAAAGGAPGRHARRPRLRDRPPGVRTETPAAPGSGRASAGRAAGAAGRRSHSITGHAGRPEPRRNGAASGGRAAASGGAEACDAERSKAGAPPNRGRPRRQRRSPRPSHSRNRRRAG